MLACWELLCRLGSRPTAATAAPGYCVHVTPEDIEQLFRELGECTRGTRVKFDLQEADTSIEGIIIDPPGQRPPGLDGGVFLQDVEDHTQIYCLCEDNGRNGAGNILVHTFVQAGDGTDRVAPPVLDDGIEERLLATPQVTCGGGILKELGSNISGVVDTDAPTPPPMLAESTEPE